MANNVTRSTACKNAMLDAQSALLAGGSLNLYTGAQPAGPGVAITSQVLVVTLQFSSPAFAAASAGVAVANAIASGTAVAAGTVTWFRCLSASGVAVTDGTVGTSGCDATIPDTAIALGATVPCSAFTLTHS
jgi:hypothetical protein